MMRTISRERFLNVAWLAVATALALDGPPDTPLRVVCPRAAVTRVVLREPLEQLRAPREARRALGLSIERTRPQGVLRIEPRGRDAAAVVELIGPTSRLRLAIETVAHGADSEVRLGAPAPEAQAVVEAPPLAPAPSPSPASLPETLAAAPTQPEPLPAQPTPAPSPAVVFDVSNLMRATPVPIGRREGLPGQLAMVLVDALRGEEHLWLRFTLEDGAAARVRAASWDAGPLPTFTQEPVGRDLRVVVQLPRASVTRKTRVTLAMDTGATYRFALSSGTLAGLWRKLFN